jgi:hypothetical protein
MSFAVGFCFMMTTFKLRELEAMDKAMAIADGRKGANGSLEKPKFLIRATEASSKTSVASEATAAPASRGVQQQTLNDVV